jgi:hypothetical protein
LQPPTKKISGSTGSSLAAMAAKSCRFGGTDHFVRVYQFAIVMEFRNYLINKLLEGTQHDRLRFSNRLAQSRTGAARSTTIGVGGTATRGLADRLDMLETEADLMTSR